MEGLTAGKRGGRLLSLPHPHHSPHPPHTETHAPAPAESPDLFAVSSSRYGPLYLKYGKGQRFANLAANLNHKGSSVKSQGWSLISVKSESRGRGGRSQHFFINKTPQVIPPCSQVRTMVGSNRSHFFPNGSCFHH